MALVAEQPSAHIGIGTGIGKGIGNGIDIIGTSVGFSPDGTRIVSGSDDSSVKVWGRRRSFALCCRVLVVAVDLPWAVADGA
eukprot:4420895-Prymnesium_polylepis.1